MRRRILRRPHPAQGQSAASVPGGIQPVGHPGVASRDNDSRRAIVTQNGVDGIRVNMVAPGYIGSAVVDLVAQMEAATRGIPQAEAREGILENLMLRRAPEPDEIADAVLFFASRMSRSVTAQCLDVTSGEFAH